VVSSDWRGGVTKTKRRSALLVWVGGGGGRRRNLVECVRKKRSYVSKTARAADSNDTVRIQVPMRHAIIGGRAGKKTGLLGRREGGE